MNLSAEAIIRLIEALEQVAKQLKRVADKNRSPAETRWMGKPLSDPTTRKHFITFTNNGTLPDFNDPWWGT